MNPTFLKKGSVVLHNDIQFNLLAACSRPSAFSLNSEPLVEVGIQLLEEVDIQLVGIPGQEVEVGMRLDVPAVVVQTHKVVVVVALVVVPPFAE